MSKTFWDNIKKMFERVDLPTKQTPILTNNVHDQSNRERAKVDETSDFTHVLKEKNIKLDLEVSSQNELLKYLVDSAKTLDPMIDSEKIYGKYLLREQQDSTNLSDGIALPHIQDESINQITMLIVRLDKPIKWDSDRQEVSLIISLLTPLPDDKFEHVKYLASISQILLSKENLYVLKKSESKVDILNLFVK